MVDLRSRARPVFIDCPSDADYKPLLRASPRLPNPRNPGIVALR